MVPPALPPDAPDAPPEADPAAAPAEPGPVANEPTAHARAPFDLSSFDLGKAWAWLVANARQMGRDLVEQALLLYYGYQQPDMPAWARVRIAAALLYVISPIDLIPDLLPGGLLDDLAILGLALRSIQKHLSEATRQKARAQLVKWFGEG